MKIYVQYDSYDPSRIRAIQTLGYWQSKGKTEQELDALVEKRNKEEGTERFKTITVSPELEHAFRFALGENEYKSYSDITDIYHKLMDIDADLDSMKDDCFHMSEWVESTIKKVEGLVPEEDRD
jgi:hypothetical protein